MSENRTRKICKHLNTKLSRATLGLDECDTIGKGRQKNLGHNKTPPKTIGQVFYVDGMKLKKTNKCTGPFTSKNCLVMLTEDYSGLGIIGWYSTKNGFIHDFTAKFYPLIKRRHFAPTELIMDNAGENQSFYEVITGKDWKMTIDAHYVPRATPQPYLRCVYACTCNNGSCKYS